MTVPGIPHLIGHPGLATNVTSFTRATLSEVNGVV
jgi:hypothetical protein